MLIYHKPHKLFIAENNINKLIQQKKDLKAKLDSYKDDFNNKHDKLIIKLECQVKKI